MSAPTIANNSLAVFLVNPAMRAVRCSYLGLDANGKIRGGDNVKLFKTLDQSLAKGDLVVVPTDEAHRVGFTVVQVAEVDVEVDYDSPETVRWVVMKVDAAAYQHALAKETQFMDAVRAADKKRRAEELRKQLLANMPEDEIKALPVIDVTPAGQ